MSLARRVQRGVLAYVGYPTRSNSTITDVVEMIPGVVSDPSHRVVVGPSGTMVRDSGMAEESHLFSNILGGVLGVGLWALTAWFFWPEIVAWAAPTILSFVLTTAWRVVSAVALSWF